MTLSVSYPGGEPRAASPDPLSDNTPLRIEEVSGFSGFDGHCDNGLAAGGQGASFPSMSELRGGSMQPGLRHHHGEVHAAAARPARRATATCARRRGATGVRSESLMFIGSSGSRVGKTVGRL